MSCNRTMWNANPPVLLSHTQIKTAVVEYIPYFYCGAEQFVVVSNHLHNKKNKKTTTYNIMVDINYLTKVIINRMSP